MSLGLNNILALQGNGFGNVSLAGSLFGQAPATGIAGGIATDAGTNAFGLLLNLGQNTDIDLGLQTTKSVALNSSAFGAVALNSQLNTNVQLNTNTQQASDVLIQGNIHAPQTTTSLVGQQDAQTSEEVEILNTVAQAPVQNPTLELNTAKEAAFTSQEENAMVGTLALNKQGELQLIDENGVVVDASFIKVLQQNPAIKEFLEQKLQSGEKITLSENVAEALVVKSKDVASQVVVKNNVLVLDVAANIDTTTQTAQQNISNEWKVSQKAENSIINPVAQDTKAATTPVANTNNQQVIQPTQNQATAQPSKEGFSLDMSFDGESDFSQSFSGDSVDQLDADWSQAQVQKNNVTQNFATHLSGKTAATVYVPVAEQVSMQLQKGLQGQVDKISLQLDPADLGKMTIDFDFSDDHHSKIMITADKQETLDMLKADAKALQKVLADAGMDAGKNSLEFSLGQNQNQYQDADKAKKFTDAKFDITGIEALSAEIESIVIPSSGVISVGKVNIVV